jgi:hypothetical protein
MFARDLFDPPVMSRPAQVAAGMTFQFGGRFLRVVKSYGTDPAAPVIVEELNSFGTTLKGQFSLWSADGVLRSAGKGWTP